MKQLNWGMLNNLWEYLFQPSVRKTHCNGRKHKENVRDYYQKWLEEQVQKLVDDTSKYYFNKQAHFKPELIHFCTESYAGEEFCSEQKQQFSQKTFQ